MAKLEMFFDYACPYCLRGYEYLTQLLPQYARLEVEWRPCEAHPRPDRYGPHSDLCARGMYVAMELGADLTAYHELMYRAALKDRADIENINAASRLMAGLLDPAAFANALSNGAYLGRLAENNRLAWQTYRFAAVPSFRMNGELLKSEENIGVTKQRLAEFIQRNMA